MTGLFAGLALLLTSAFVSGNPTPEDVLRSEGWPEYLVPQAVSVMRCESSLNQYATNGRYKGLFQLSTPFWFNYAGVDASMWADPYVNARAAWAVYQYGGGWSQWECRP